MSRNVQPKLRVMFSCVRPLTVPDGASRDVWVLSDTVQPIFKSLWRPTNEAAQIQRSPRELPSRAADNLFWLGRNVEHADWTLRVLRNCLSRIEEDSGPRQDLGLARTALTTLLNHGGASPVGVPTGLDEPQVIAHLARTLMTATDRPYGLPQTLDHVHRIAGLTRDRLSLEAWRTLAGRRWLPKSTPTSIGEQLDLIDSSLAAISAFNGLTHENMTRNFGWTFLDMGRRLSRAQNLAQILLSAFRSGQKDEGDGGLLFVLELADSFITYRSRYRLNPVIALVLDLLIVDETNPRSLAFQLAALSSHIDQLPQTSEGRGRTEAQRAALSMLNAVRLADVEGLAQLDAGGARPALTTLLVLQIETLPRLLDAITRRYFSMTEKEPHWVRARSGQGP